LTWYQGAESEASEASRRSASRAGLSTVAGRLGLLHGHLARGRIWNLKTNEVKTLFIPAATSPGLASPNRAPTPFDKLDACVECRIADRVTHIPPNAKIASDF
jgi:hypothetical protein